MKTMGAQYENNGSHDVLITSFCAGKCMGDKQWNWMFERGLSFVLIKAFS